MANLYTFFNLSYALSSRASENELLLIQRFGNNLDEDTIFKIMKSDFFEQIHGLREDKNKITKSEFVLLMLSVMEKVEMNDILFLSKVFEHLDRGYNGKLDYNDFHEVIVVGFSIRLYLFIKWT